MHHTITSRAALRRAKQGQHSYRAILIPKDVNPEDVEDLADAGLLPTLRFKADDATQAEGLAYLATGKQVLRVEKVVEA